MLREQLNAALKTSMKAKKERAVSTIRLILASLKDRDINERSSGNMDGISDDEILKLLQSMVKQRNESISMYEKGGRLELAEQESQEIEVIKSFLPAQMSDAEIEKAVDDLIAKTGAESVKDIGKVMGGLREGYAGRMDFAKAGALVKKRLA
ncbi:GatB/YqeY domain-containing protein [Alphaproteobacteria bacterium HT1-32]|nr:GatB/YqeY domain-containing protein [Alphaproteobacteria bacterium HT1-32]|tara:strand:+ start:10979 stop:11434 length:456 start_codon:yes stop_codon:yes gene_type:complete